MDLDFTVRGKFDISINNSFQVLFILFIVFSSFDFENKSSMGSLVSVVIAGEFAGGAEMTDVVAAPSPPPVPINGAGGPK